MKKGHIKSQQGKGDLCDSGQKKQKNKASFRADEYWRQIYFLRHKRRLEEIDNADPRLPEVEFSPSNAINGKNNRFNRAMLIQSKIDRDNALLLADIHQINSRIPNLEENPMMQFTINKNWKRRMLNVLRIGLENCDIYQRLQAIKPNVPSRDYYHRWYMQMNRFRLIASRFPPYRLCAPFEGAARQRAREVPKPIVYLDFEIVGKGVGRVVFELRADLAPMTAENFRSLCVGDRGKSYRCSELTRVISGLIWQGGDGISSIYGETFPNENFRMKHDAEGILSMVNYGENTANSEFRISATALPPMDKKQVAFGKVIMGMPFLRNMARLAGATERGKPLTKIIVTGCGEATEEGLMNLDPPSSLMEQRIPQEQKKLETLKNTKADEPLKGK